MKVSVKDIAQAMDLSTSTVSRALNNNKMISKATIKAVKEKAVDMGYYQNSLEIMKDFKKTSTRLVGVCVPNLRNPICVDMIKGVEEFFSVRDFGVIVMDSEEDIAKEEKNVKVMLDLDVQGLILFPASDQSAKRTKPYTENKIPTVYVCNIAEDKTIHSVGIDEERAFRILTEYLIQMGHEKITFIGGSDKFVNRVRGFEAAITDNLHKAASVIRCEPTKQAGFRVMKNMIEQMDVNTGIVAASDYIALGAMDAIYEMGKKIPEDYSIVALDNVDISGSRCINLTTMDQPGADIGKKAGEIIFHELNYGPYEYKHTEILDTYLVIRGSCGRNTK